MTTATAADFATAITRPGIYTIGLGRTDAGSYYPRLLAVSPADEDCEGEMVAVAGPDGQPVAGPASLGNAQLLAENAAESLAAGVRQLVTLHGARVVGLGRAEEIAGQ